MAGVGVIGALRQISSKFHLLCLQKNTKYFSSLAAGTHVSYELKDDVAVVKINSPNSKVNTLSKTVQQEFVKIFDELWLNNDVNSIVLISGKPSCFLAGADIGMLKASKSAMETTALSRAGQQMLEKVEKSKKPVVAAIMGMCLGGGLEVALACHYRIAVKNKKTSLGVPEVMLGLLPGAGGTQRLPKLVSIPNALDMMLTGKNIRPDKAKKMGLVDQIIEPLGPGIMEPENRTLAYLEEIAVITARNLTKGVIKRVPRKRNIIDKITDLVLKYDSGRDLIFKQAMTKVIKLSGGLYPAPLKILDVSLCFIHLNLLYYKWRL
ncbi:HADHA [Acanthosepion pharaonis]|uniref:enoyl-CoA hydratase n=1 Tax=Acanthosepion pharaonis TaxID=158019 RepID=A0A812DKK1_ACAPH|nr:HADHA [Sepia pharaonis]